MAENVSNMGRDMDIQVHEVQKSPNNFNPKRISPRHIIKLSRIKHKQNFESSKRLITLQGSPYKAISEFLRKNCAYQETQTNLKFKKIENISSIFSDHNGIKVGIINNMKKIGKLTNM